MNKMLTTGLLIAAVTLSTAAEPGRKAPAASGRRTPVVAGRFYPANVQKLAALVDKDLKAVDTRLPLGAEVVALLVPHAGLEFSGLTAARAYKALKPGSYDTVIVVGTCHYKELEGAAIYPGAYAIPGGAMPYDAALSAALRRLSPLIRENASAHKKEYSIEVQLPFLRRVLGPKTKLVAMVMNTQDLETARQVGAAIAEAAKGKRVLLVASSDQSHYPSGSIADAVDRSTLEALKSLDPSFFWLTNRFFMNRGLPHLAVTYCGEGAVLAVLAAARQLGANRVYLLDHINSGDVVSEREYNHVVGYAAAVFARQPDAAPAPRLALGDKQRVLLLSSARKALEEGAAGHKVSVPLSAEPVFNLPAAVYVSLRLGGKTLAVSGSTDPQESLLEAVVHHAAALAPRAVEEAKLEISVLSAARTVKPDDVKPGDGLLLEHEGKTGVLMPEAWGSFSREEALRELCAKKAGLPKDCWKDSKTQLKVFSADLLSD